MLSTTIQELKTASTQRILSALSNTVADDKYDEIQELPADDSLTPQQEVQIPNHFNAKARDIIKKLLASNLYSLTGTSTEVFTWVSKVKPFSIKFSYPHPSVVTLDNEPQVFHEVITNIDAQGKINYQVKTFDDSLHYIDIKNIPYLALQLNHTNIVSPHLEVISEEEQSKSGKNSKSSQSDKSGGLRLGAQRLSF